MSVGSNLQEMENVVTKGAKPAEPMPKLTTGIPDGQTGNWEDLGGPTPENYKSEDDSAKLKEPSATLSSVKNIVNKGAKSAEPMQKLSSGAVKEETEEEEVVAEEETVEEETVEEETVEEETTEEVVAEQEEVVEYNMEEDVEALLQGEELSEEFQEKARTIFETAIKTKVAEIKEQIQTQYEEQLIEKVSEIKEELVDRVDAYLEYVADEWIQENALAIEHGLKTEMTESFLVGMKSLFEDHYVTIPEDKYDVLSTMVEKLDEMEDKLNEQIERNVALNRRLAESVADVIFAEVAEGLALSQKDKLATLAENVEFDSEETYREKLVTLRNSYFSKTATSTQREVSEEVESVEDSTSSISPLMESYLSVLSRASKK